MESIMFERIMKSRCMWGAEAACLMLNLLKSCSMSKLFNNFVLIWEHYMLYLLL